nr:amyloid-beta A4 precursor protein-binding family A member 2 [Misgurnus anguillicaudatus]
MQMAEQDVPSDGGLGFEQSSPPAPHDPSNPQSEAQGPKSLGISHSSLDSSINPPESKTLPCEHLQSPELEDLDSYNLIEPPPLDWRSDSSSDAGSVGELESCSVGEFEVPGSLSTDTISAVAQTSTEAFSKTEELSAQKAVPEIRDFQKQEEAEEEKEVMNKETEKDKVSKRDLDHSHIQSLLNQLHLFHPSTPISSPAHCAPDDSDNRDPSHHTHTPPEAAAPFCHAQSATADPDRSVPSALLFSQEYQRDLLQLLDDPEPEEPSTILQLVHTPLLTPTAEPQPGLRRQSSDADEMISISHSEDIWHRHLQDELVLSGITEEDRWAASERLTPDQSVGENNDLQEDDAQSAYKNVPGPCDPEDLLDGVIFTAKYLGSTQLQSEKNPSTNARMSQAQEAVDRIKAPEGESQPMTEVDLFISTQRIKVLSADTQEAMMDHALQMISYIADIGNIVVLMARRKPAGRKTEDSTEGSTAPPKKCWMICHVFSSDDAHIIAQAIGQAFGVAYQQFLYTNGIKSSDLRPGEYSDYLGTQELYNGDLVHFSRSENIREEFLCSFRSLSVNGTSLVGLPIATCQNIIRELKTLAIVKLSIVHCPPVTMAIIKRPDPKYQLGFSVEDGIICSLMRGGIAERGGIRVGHRIIEINGQSVVATPHEKIIHILSSAVGEIHLKTMPTSTYRLLTGLDQPVFL